ncbi:MAG: glycosyltransferase family 4 protein [Planctomycetota bacterium]
MKLLYVASVLPKRSETFVYREVLALGDRGHQVSIASVHAPQSGLGDDRIDALGSRAVPVYGQGLGGKIAVYRDATRNKLWRPVRGIFETPMSYWPKYQFQAEAGYALARRVRDLGIEHIHAHMAHVPTTIAMHAAEALGVTFSFTGHAADLFRDRSALKSKLNRAAFVACISRWHRGFYQRMTDLPDAKMPIIRCGVEVSEQPACGGVGILAVGRLVEKKGFDVLIQAVAQMDQPFPLTIVGDGPERAVLESLIHQFDLADRVKLMGAMDNKAIRGLMREAALVVLPCRVSRDGDQDGIPVVLMEAMAEGVAVVSGDLPAIRELIEPGKTGELVEPGNVDQLRETLTVLLHEDERRAALADSGRAWVADEFSQARNIDRLEHAFRRALGGGGEARVSSSGGSAVGVGV